MERVYTLHKNSGIGKTACIAQIKDCISFKDNPIRVVCLYHYYMFLKKYCNYDKVWIMSNIATSEEKYWECTNILKDLPIIFGTERKNLLLDYNIDDMFFHQSTPNFYGGTIFPQYPYNVNRVTEWWLANHNREDSHIYYIQDDPLFFNSNLPKLCNYRLFDLHNVKCLGSKKFPQEKVNAEIELTRLMRSDIEAMAEDCILAFCGIDYNKFWEQLKEKNRPVVKKWDQFNCYLWQGVNDNLDVKLKNYAWEEKKYACEYHGVTKSGKRTKVTTEFYKDVPKPFMHIRGKQSFFKDAFKEGVDYDRYDTMPYYELLQVVAKNAKSTFVTHEDNILGNQISPRYFDCMLSDIVCFVDIRFDPEKKLTDNEELKEFMYVTDGKDMTNKIAIIENNEEFYRHIVQLQRQSIFNKFKEYIDEENINKYKNI